MKPSSTSSRNKFFQLTDCSVFRGHIYNQQADRLIEPLFTLLPCVHIKNHKIERGVIIISSGKTTIEVEPASTLFVFNDLCLFTIKVNQT